MIIPDSQVAAMQAVGWAQWREGMALRLATLLPEAAAMYDGDWTDVVDTILRHADLAGIDGVDEVEAFAYASMLLGLGFEGVDEPGLHSTLAAPTEQRASAIWSYTSTAAQDPEAP